MYRPVDNVSPVIGTTFRYVMLILFAVIFIFPFFYVFVLSSWADSEIFRMPPHMWFGDSWGENWDALFEKANFFINMFNSFAIAVLTTGSVLFFCTMGGFAMSHYNFKGKGFVYGLMLTLYMVPQALTIIPAFQVMKTFGWVNTWWPLIVPGMANPFGIFLMTQYVKTSVPSDLMDAARIDGMTEYGILLKVVFPLVRPGLSVLGIMTFIGSWNNFIWANVILSEPSISTIPVMLADLHTRSNGGFGSMMVGNALALIPLTLILLLFSKQIIAGLTEGSVKG